MLLTIECVVSCVLFGTFIIISVLKNPTVWINEYPEPVQKRYNGDMIYWLNTGKIEKAVTERHFSDHYRPDKHSKIIIRRAAL